MKTSYICLTCNKEFFSYFSNAKYCSQTCYGIAKRGKQADNTPIFRVESICDVCGKIMSYNPTQKKSEFKFCSNECYYKHKKGQPASNKIPSEQLIEALQYANTLTNGFYLSCDFYETIRIEENLPSHLVIRRRFSGWENALTAAGINSQPSTNRPRKSQSTTKNTIPPTVDAIKSDILRVRDIVQQTPTVIQYKQHGLFEWNLASLILTGKRGAWAKTCNTCGLHPHTTAEGSGCGSITQYTTPSGTNVNMQSSYEVRFADRLTYWHENWICHQELPDGISFVGYANKPAKYHPDFFLPLKNIYFDTKGWFRPKDQGKMKLVYKQHPDLKIYLVFKEQLALAEHMASFDEWFAACSFVQF
jgi:hypothetical protein